jgi:hypothetical protein
LSIGNDQFTTMNLLQRPCPADSARPTNVRNRRRGAEAARCLK